MEKEIIIRKFLYLNSKLKEISIYYNDYLNEKDPLKNKKNYYSLQRVSEEAIETAIKINIFVLKSKGIFPKSYYNSFLELKEYINLDEEILKDLAKTAKFRNILAHEYVELKENNCIISIKKIIEIYPKYIKELKKLF